MNIKLNIKFLLTFITIFYLLPLHLSAFPGTGNPKQKASGFTRPSVTDSKQFKPASIKIDVLLKKMIQAYGGRKNLEKSNKLRQLWEVKAIMSGETGKDLRLIEQPSKLLVKLDYPTRSEYRLIKDGTGLKVYNKTRRIEAFGPMLDAMKLQLIRIYNPLILEQEKKRLEALQSKDQYVIKLTEGTLVGLFFINKKNYIIEKVIGQLHIQGMGMEFVTEYSDFKKVSGVLFAHKETKYAGGMNTAVMTLKEVQLGTFPKGTDFSL